MMTINLNVPKGWHELTQEQLRYLLFLLSEEYTATAIKTLCLFRWTSLRVLNYADDGILLQLNKTQFFINALQIAEAVSSLSWIDGLPKIPVRIESIGKLHALKADFQGVPFETFFVCENLYQGFLHTKNEDLLRQMATHLYGSHRVRPNKAERVGIFYWFASLKDYLARSFPNFLQPAGRSTDTTFRFIVRIVFIVSECQEILNFYFFALIMFLGCFYHANHAFRSLHVCPCVENLMFV